MKVGYLYFVARLKQYIRETICLTFNYHAIHPILVVHNSGRWPILANPAVEQFLRNT